MAHRRFILISPAISPDADLPAAYTMSLDNLRSTIAHGTASSKLAVLHHNKAQLDEALQSLQAAQAVSDPWARLRSKAEIIKNLQIPQATAAGRAASDTLAFISVQERYTPHRSLKQFDEWNERLNLELECLERRVGYAVVYADMVDEWLRKDSSSSQDRQPTDFIPSSLDASPSTQSDTLPPLPVQPFDPRTYLVSQNVPPILLETIGSLAKRATTFGNGQLKATIHPNKIRSAMLTLSRDARSYPADLRKQLVEESSKRMVLEELGGALTQMWTAIGSWQWPAAGIKQVVQTHLNGKERAFLDIDIITAIFLQVVGDTWSEFFANELKVLREHEAWPFKAELQGAMDKEEETDVRRQLELISLVDESGHVPHSRHTETGYLEARRQELKANSGRIISHQGEGYNDTTHSYDPHETLPSSEPSNAWSSLLDAISPAKAYSDVFRLITTDIALARLVAPEEEGNLVVLHGDLQDFGKSVSHDVLRAVLEYFGMPPPWVRWFTTFLRVPILQDDGTIHITDRGTPFGQSPSMLADELLLVLLDLAMACTTGITAHRNHDDFWIWNVDTSAVAKAWEQMQDFAAQTGLGWNKSKTSCTIVRCRRPGSSTNSSTAERGGLPDRLLRIGVLELVESGKWRVDSALVAQQAEAALAVIQSDEPRSFLGMMGVINKHQAYLLRNCGLPTYVNGPEYLEIVRSIMEQFEGIVAAGRNIGEWAEDQFHYAFPQHAEFQMSEALIVWPLKLGGAGLHSLRNPRSGIRTRPRSRQSRTRAIRQRVYPQLDSISRRSDSALGRWIRTKHDLPPLVPYETFAKWCILHGSSNQASTEANSSHVSLTPSHVALKGLQLYGNSLERQFGPLMQGQVVVQELVPNYAIQDIESKVKQLFA
ncbi:hypothetical protein QFC19_008543 [Naganishia cerealis]|uniref:Uncharacterized protein n=1 Tax=Naganishia cerealis TaxID=610337 RepID=A0ACC2V1E1_9TREE|nr:hypothetical protein QFC19_008543 [Naganishia cerealis]